MSEQFEFPQLTELANTTAYDVMAKILESKRYDSAKTSEWVDRIGNGVIEKMRKQAPYFKYMVSCFVVEKVGAGMHYESVAHWDPRTDGTTTSMFENESLVCLCTVVGVAI